MVGYHLLKPKHELPLLRLVYLGHVSDVNTGRNKVESLWLKMLVIAFVRVGFLQLFDIFLRLVGGVDVLLKLMAHEGDEVPVIVRLQYLPRFYVWVVSFLQGAKLILVEVFKHIGVLLMELYFLCAHYFSLFVR